MDRVYLAIDLKSFYASYECIERGLDPLTARLVVADVTRTEKTICLAISPALKEAIHVGGRARLFEVMEKARLLNVDFLAAPPQMKKYMKKSQEIFGIYANFVSVDDIHVYSIDEVFIDATEYLKLYKKSAREFAEMLVHEVLKRTGITATAGIGTNLYLAKIAMDIVAKKMSADSHGVRIAELDEESYQKNLWTHTPLTDFWRIGSGISRRLLKMGIHNMGELAHYSLTGSENLYREFGKNAELLIDHAWGFEPVTMADIKNYETNHHSVSSGQVLKEPYDAKKARLIAWEMADSLALSLFERHLKTDKVVLTVLYDKDCQNYNGSMHKDFYGRLVPKPAHGTLKISSYTNNSKVFSEATLELFDKIINFDLKVRAIYVVAEDVKHDGASLALKKRSFFEDAGTLEAEKKNQRLQEAEILIRKKYGKNAILKAANFEEGATMRERNYQVGGHKG